MEISGVPPLYEQKYIDPTFTKKINWADWNHHAN